MSLNEECSRGRRRLYVTLLSICLSVVLFAHPASADAIKDVGELTGFWRANAPRCETSPSSENCSDGDMTLFSGLLCAVGEIDGCSAVKDAQDAKGGGWYRSPRLQRDRTIRKGDSFSWDMALGVMLYTATTKDYQAFGRWLSWVEASRPCLVESPKIEGKQICLVRGWPRVCTDDSEKGCTLRPGDLATLALFVDALKIEIPPPAEDPLPGGVAGVVFQKLQEESKAANRAFCVSELIPRARGLQPTILLLSSAVNEPGFPRHLVGVEIMLFRMVGRGSPTVDRAAQILASLQPDNPFFQYLAGSQPELVAEQLLKLAPKQESELPKEKVDWAWQRDTADKAWEKSNLWDFVFMGRVVSP
ncbi:hypothetical protein [Xanthobacter autotrophicus]|uniref:hypothetical protein n=1 Tax=Xanthobacter autotrophicus TaxID=280 RepID=UPI00372CAB29